MYVRGKGTEQLQGWLPEYFGGAFPADTWTAVMSSELEGADARGVPRARSTSTARPPASRHAPRRTRRRRPDAAAATAARRSRRRSPSSSPSRPADAGADPAADAGADAAADPDPAAGRPAGCSQPCPTPTPQATPSRRPHRRRARPRGPRRRSAVAAALPRDDDLDPGRLDARSSPGDGVSPDPTEVVHPTADDPVVAALSEAVGGPVGSRRRAGAGSAVPRGGRRCGCCWRSRRCPSRSAWSRRRRAWTTSGAPAHPVLPRVHLRGRRRLHRHRPGRGCLAVVRRRVATSPGTVLEEPALVGLWAYAAARVTHVLAGSPAVGGRSAVASRRCSPRPRRTPRAGDLRRASTRSGWRRSRCSRPWP